MGAEVADKSQVARGAEVADKSQVARGAEVADKSQVARGAEVAAVGRRENDAVESRLLRYYQNPTAVRNSIRVRAWTVRKRTCDTE